MTILALLLLALPLPAASSRELLDAARADELATVRSLLTQGVDPNQRDEDGTTALAWAAYRSNLSMVQALLQNKANPNIPTHINLTPLAIAITSGATPIVQALLAAGADPNIVRENGESPLMTAIRLQQAGTVRLLLQNKANPNAFESKFKQTPLMWAAGNPEIVRLLLDHGANPRAITSAWDVKYTAYAPTTVTLGKTGIPWNTDGEFTARKGGLNALFFAVQRHDLTSVRLLLDAGLDPNQPAADGTTPLLAALFNWDPPSSTFIPGRGAPAPAGSSQSFGPDLPIANLLLDRGAKPQAIDGTGYTPLHGIALAIANLTLGSEFRRGGAYGNKAALLTISRSAPKSTPAQKDLALTIAQRLLAAGADPNLQTLYPTPGPAGDVRLNPAPPGSSALHIAAASRNLPLLQLLLDHRANPNLLRKDGHTPFSVSVMAGDVEAAKLLLSRGANLHMRYHPTEKIPDPVDPITLPRSNQSILHIAALSGSPQIIAFLHSQGAPLNLLNSNHETPLQLADHQERYREAIERQGAEGDAEKLKTITRKTTITSAFERLQAAQP